MDEKNRFGRLHGAARCGIDSGREIDWMGGALQGDFFFLFSLLNAEMQKCKRCLCVRRIVSDSVGIGRGEWENERFGEGTEERVSGGSKPCHHEAESIDGEHR